MRVITVPKIQEVRAVVTPPLYTGLTTYQAPVEADGISGLPGTSVRVIALSNRRLTAGTLTLHSEAGSHPVAMAPRHDPHEAVAEFTMSQPGRFEVRVVDEAGQSSTENYSAPLQLLEDQHPIVRLQQPRAVSFATPSA